MVLAAVALSSLARLAMFRNTFSRDASPSCKSEFLNSGSPFYSSSKILQKCLEIIYSTFLTVRNVSLSWGITKIKKALFWICRLNFQVLQIVY